ncbi:MAG: ATP-binding protein [Clostridiales bacterium]|nr:ATP-binding protein [Clostridiales bacterium]
MVKRLERPDYLEWLVKKKDKQIIKVVTGVRRCGKSTLFEIYREYLLSQGILPEQIISLNFEDLEFEELTEYKQLYLYVKERLCPDKMNYIFLDEIQHVEAYEKAVDSLFLRENCDVYITGSNAYFMSGELATLLTGRYAQLSMMPLSFAEFCEGLEGGRRNLTLTEKFNLYMETGSFPYVLKYQYEADEAKEYMYGIYHTILLNDVVKRLKIADVNMLEAVTRYLMHNIGSRTTPTAISNTMVSKQRKIDPKTVDRYIRGLTDSLLFYEARRYNIKGKELLNSISKYYACDVAVRNMLVRGKDTDIGHILENLVYLELRRRGYEVFVGQYGADGEVDFVAIKNGIPEYYQVAQTVLDERVLQRELAPLQKIQDNFPKYLLTLDELFGEMNYEGIQKKNALKWMLGQV